MRAEKALIARRHVIYVGGYDPQGAEGYYRLFERSWKRFLTIWPLTSKLGPLELDAEDFAHWDVEAAGPNWRVATRYEFLRQEHMIRANMAEPMTRQIPRALGWAFDYFVSGALLRVLRTSWAFGLVLIYFQMMLIWWLVLSVVGGGLIAYAAAHALGLPVLLALVIGIACTFAIFALLRPLADRWFVVQINSHWPHLCAFARGERSCFDPLIDACAERLIAAVRADAADEIIVVGHSGGGALAPAVIARALERDPDIGRREPPLVLLTLGSITPGAALHPKAVRLRAVTARLAAEPSIVWVARRHHEFLGFRSGRRNWRACRGGALQSLDLDAALPRYAVAATLPAAALRLLPPALPVHHGERSPRPVRLFHAAHRPGSGRDLGETRL